MMMHPFDFIGMAAKVFKKEHSKASPCRLPAVVAEPKLTTREDYLNAYSERK